MSNWPNIANPSWKRIRCWSVTTATPPSTPRRERFGRRHRAGERADEALSREDFSKTSDMDEAAHDNMYDGEQVSRVLPKARGSNRAR